MRSALVRVSGIAAAVLLLATTTACGGGGGDGDDAATSAGSSESSAGAATGEADEAPADGPADGVVFVDTVDDPAATVLLSDAGFEPGKIAVSVGDVVKFSTEDGTYGVVVGSIDSRTVTTGIDEYYRFDKPGSYPVSEEISGATATVTVG